MSFDEKWRLISKGKVIPSRLSSAIQAAIQGKSFLDTYLGAFKTQYVPSRSDDLEDGDAVVIVEKSDRRNIVVKLVVVFLNGIKYAVIMSDFNVPELVPWKSLVETYTNETGSTDHAVMRVIIFSDFNVYLKEHPDVETKLNSIIPDNGSLPSSPGMVPNTSITLKSHQILALKKMVVSADISPYRNSDQSYMRGGILKLEAGTGKTLDALAYLSLQGLHSDASPFLWLTPKVDLVYQVAEEVVKFYPGTKVLMIVSSGGRTMPEGIVIRDTKHLTDEDIAGAKIVITTYSSLRTGLTDQLIGLVKRGEGAKVTYSPIKDRPMGIRMKKEVGATKLFYVAWDTIIADESSEAFSNPKTATFETVLSLWCRRFWCLTANEVINTILDLWSQLICCGYRDITSPKNWSRKFYSGVLTQQIVLVETEIREELPPLTEHHELLEWHPKHRAVYDFYKNSKSNIREHNLLLVDALRSICITPLLIMPSKDESKRKQIDKVYYKLPEELREWLRSESVYDDVKKFDVAVDIVKKHSTEKIIVYCSYIAPLRALKTLLDDEGIKSVELIGEVSGDKRQLVLKEFNDGEARVMMASYKFGTGLNITVASVEIFLNSWWNWHSYEQAIARVYRIGQTKEVHIYELEMKDSIEQRIDEIRKDKKKLAEDLGDIERKDGLNEKELSLLLS